MKVVLVSLARRGGMVHFVVELANAMGRLVSTSVVMSDVVPDTYVDAGIPKHNLRTGDDALHSAVRALSPVTWFRLWRALATEADLVHVTGAHAWNPAVAVLAKMLGKPLVYTVHDPLEHPGAPLSIRLSNWLTSRLADTVVVLTEDGRRRLLENGYSPRKVQTIPHGAYAFFRRWMRHGVRARKTILCFGRFEPYKGMQHLVAAFTRIQQSIPDWNLVLAGEGELPPFLRVGTPPGIEIRNEYVPDADVALMMQRAQFVVIPYTEATQSGVIAIAYAFGRPVIATSVGGLGLRRNNPVNAEISICGLAKNENSEAVVIMATPHHSDQVVIGRKPKVNSPWALTVPRMSPCWIISGARMA